MRNPLSLMDSAARYTLEDKVLRFVKTNTMNDNVLPNNPIKIIAGTK